MKSVKPMTTAERSRKHRAEKKAEGWRLVQVMLEPRSAAVLDVLIENQGMTTAQAINHCIVSSNTLTTI